VTAVNGRTMRAKGAAFEREVVRVLREHGHLNAQRAYGSGRPRDIGDVVGLSGFAVEVKCQRSLDLAGWCDEVAREAANVGAGVVPVVVAKRRGRPTEDAYVVIRLRDFADLTSKTGR